MSQAEPTYRRLCKHGCGRTVMEDSKECGPCWAAIVLADFVPPKSRKGPYRRGVCKHCGQERRLTGRDMCLRCQRAMAPAELERYPVVARPGRRKAAR